MDERDMEMYVAQVVDTAERTFGADADPALLESYAREAVLDLWLTKARVTVYVAELALNQVREEISRRSDTVPAQPRRAAWSTETREDSPMLQAHAIYAAARREDLLAEARQAALHAQIASGSSAHHDAMTGRRLQVDSKTFDAAIRRLSSRLSRRGLLGAASALTLSFAAARTTDGTAAKKRKNRKKAKKLQLNAFRCVSVGGKCRGSSANCCSGICQGQKPKQGKKDRSICVAHNSGACVAGDDVCLGNDVACADDSTCTRTTGDAPFCAKRLIGQCTECSKDAECEALFGAGAACVVCPLTCTETTTVCFAPGA